MKRLIIIRLALLLPLLSLSLAALLPAQTVGEWEVVWSKPPDPTLEVPRFIEDLGAGNYMVGTQATVMITWDGGRNWREVFSLPSKTVHYATTISTGEAAAPGHYLLVLDSMIRIPNGWRYESSLRVTTDGGNDWRKVELPSPSYVHDLTMLNEREGLILFNHDGASTLYYTDNGGLSWSPRPLPEGARPYTLVMIGTSEWGVWGQDTAIDTYYYYRTDNAGEGWERSQDSVPYLRDFSAIDGRTIWGVGGKGTGQGSLAHDFIQLSTDGGMTWKTILDTYEEYSRGLYAVDFADPMNGIAVGSKSRILRTTDGGETWRTEWGTTDLMVFSESFFDVAYPAVDDALIAGWRYALLAYHGNTVLTAPTITRPDSNLTNHPLPMTLAWTSVSGATSYEVQIGDTAYEYNIAAPEIFEDPWIDTSGISDTLLTLELLPHRRYYVRVRAQGNGIEGAWSRPIYIRSEGEGVVLPMPSFLYPRPGNIDIPVDVTISWSQVKDAVGYDLVLGTDSRYLFNPIHFDHVSDTSQFVAGLKPGTLYFAALRSRNLDGVTSDWREMPFTTAKISSVSSPSRQYSISIRPNVATEQISLVFPMTWSGAFTVRVLAVDGRVVQSDLIAVPGGGEHLHALDCSDLPSGQYLVVVDAEGERFTLPVVVVR